MNRRSADYTGQYQVTFALRPVRTGYLIRQKSTDDLLLAVEEATSRWGGITEPLLPYDEDGTVRPYLGLGSRIHPVDHFTVVNNQDPGLFERLQPQVGGQLIPWASTGDTGIHQLFLSAPEPTAALTVLEQISAASQSASPYEAVTSGVVRDSQRDTWRDFGVYLKPGTGPDGWRTQLDRETAIDLTASQLHELPGNAAGILPAVILLGTGDDFDDAVAYWNLRALSPLSFDRAPTVFTKIASLRDGELFKAISELSRRRITQTEPDVFIVCKPDAQAGVKELISAAGWTFDEGTQTRATYSAPGFGEKSRPITVRFKSAPFIYAAGRRHVGAYVTQLTHFQTTSTVVDAPSPVTFRRPAGGYVRARMWGAPPLDLPPGGGGARLFMEAGAAVDHAIEFLTSPNSRYTVHLKIPEKGELLASSLREAGITLNVSDKGQLATGVHTRLGDLDVLREPDTIAVIKALTTRRIQTDAKRLAAALPDLRPTDAGALAARLLHVRQEFRSVLDIGSIGGLSAPSVGPVVERLVVSGFVIRGFKVVCDVCGMDHFVQLSDWKPSVQCPGCLSTARVAVGPPNNDMELHYRLNSLVDRASDNGVLGHLLLVAALIRFNPSAYVIPGANLEWSGRKCEVDAIALIGPDIWSGEVKPKAAEFTRAQISSDVEIAQAVRAASYVMACAEALPEATITDAIALCRQANVRLWTLEGTAANLIQRG